MSRLVLSIAMLLAAACAGPARSAANRPPDAAQKPLAQKAAPAAADAPTAVASAAKPARTRVICTMERPTGSNMPERVCHTEESAEATRLRTQDALRASPRLKLDEGLPAQPTPAGTPRGR